MVSNISNKQPIGHLQQSQHIFLPYFVEKIQTLDKGIGNVQYRIKT